MNRAGFGAIVCAIASTACFATRNDVRILQGDVFASRVEAARQDSARARQLTAILNALNTELAHLSDSVRDVSNRLERFRGDTRTDMRSVQEALFQVEELTGQSQRRLQEMRADMDARSSQPVTAPAPTAMPSPTDTTTPAAVNPATPGPNQLWLIAAQQRDQHSYETARKAYQDLLDNYPTSEHAPEAQYWIAEMLNFEGRTNEADSTYQIVLAKYPRAPEAAKSMYKLALSLARQNKCADAKAMMDRVTREFPQSDEAVRAKDWTCTSR